MRSGTAHSRSSSRAGRRRRRSPERGNGTRHGGDGVACSRPSRPGSFRIALGCANRSGGAHEHGPARTDLRPPCFSHEACASRPPSPERPPAGRRQARRPKEGHASFPFSSHHSESALVTSRFNEILAKCIPQWWTRTVRGSEHLRRRLPPAGDLCKGRSVLLPTGAHRPASIQPRSCRPYPNRA